jgi:hypothetical protein
MVDNFCRDIDSSRDHGVVAFIGAESAVPSSNLCHLWNLWFKPFSVDLLHC